MVSEYGAKALRMSSHFKAGTIMLLGSMIGLAYGKSPKMKPETWALNNVETLHTSTYTLISPKTYAKQVKASDSKAMIEESSMCYIGSRVTPIQT